MNPNVWRPTGDASHIVLDEQGRAFILGTKMRVSMIWIDYHHNGHSPEQIVDSYPHLTLAQVHAALSYYYDHSATVDVEIAEGLRYADEMRANFEDRPGHQAFMEKVRRYRESNAAKSPAEEDASEVAR